MSTKQTIKINEAQLRQIISESVKTIVNEIIDEGPTYGTVDKMVKKFNDWRGSNGGKINKGLSYIYRCLANSDDYMKHVEKNAKRAAAMSLRGNPDWEWFMEDYNDNYGVVDNLKRLYINLPGAEEKIRKTYSELFNKAFRDAWDDIRKRYGTRQ
jgi:hypothetical protein